MTNLIVEVSKYLMILLTAVYTYTNFRFFSLQDMEKKREVCGEQSRAIFSVRFLTYPVMYPKTGNESVKMMFIAFYVAQVVFFLCYIYTYRFLYRNVSRLLVNNMCILLCVGSIMLTRLSLDKGLDKAARQFVIVVISAVLSWLVPYVMERVWQPYKLQWVYAGVGILVLLIIYLTGSESFGAQLSLTFRGFSVQPSEFVKLTFMLFTASTFYQFTDFKTVVTVTTVAAAHMLIMMLSKDLGGALISFVTYLLMLFVATSDWFYLGAGTILGAGVSVGAYQLFDHVKRRVLAWSNPWTDIDNKGYQITRSLFAIGTGDWFGMGLCQGMPGKIPVVEEDFISSAVSEEMGGIFTICVLLIYLRCFIQFMMIATSMQAVFYKLIAFGLGMEYIIQIFLTVGGVTKFISSTGVTPPFMSYGGSSILSIFILFGMIQGLYILKRNDQEELEEGQNLIRDGRPVFGYARRKEMEP